MKLSAAEKLDGQDGDLMSAWMQTNDEAITQEEEEPRRYEKDEGKRGEPLKIPGAASSSRNMLKKEEG